MEDVLDVYEQAYDPAHPVVCFDENSVVPHADVRPTLPVAPGVPERIDSEYERKGTANLFFLVEPLRGGFCVACSFTTHPSTPVG